MLPGMKTIEVYDPALCCSTGVCGPAPDEALVAFAGALEGLKAKGHAVTRFNLAQEPMAFARNPQVKSVLEKQGDAGLPLVFVDGELYFRGVYPTAEQLGKVAGEACCSPGETCCSSEPEKKPIAFVKVEAPKVSATGSSCCDPSSGCC